MNEVVVDTNVLVYCFDGKLDLRGLLDNSLQENFSLVTIKKCMDELLVIKRQDVHNFFLFYGIKIVDFNAGKNTDDTLLEYCTSKKCLLFTEDKKLKNKANEIGIKTLSLDGRSVRISDK
jgi:rRNA-processing protein FCF1